LLWAFTGTDQEELQEIMEARTIIEENLAGLAAKRGSSEDIQTIGVAVQFMRDSIARGDSILEADMAFHMAVSAAAKNVIMRNAVQLLRNLLRHWLQYKVLIPDIPQAVLKRHVAIYRAIASRRPNAARGAMRLHLEETTRLVTDVVKRRKSAKPIHSRG
jgi:GntR family transcriptional repressor for pyruvate dehydrogenase complex